MEENYKLAKWLSGEMSQEELKAFQSEPDFAIYEKIKNHSAQLEVPTLEEQAMLSKIVNTPKKEVKTVSLTKSWLFKVAAILVIGLGLFYTYTTFQTSTELAGDGTQKAFLLPDNSEVVLNSGSEIEYKKMNWDNNRTLELHGEAYFKVAKGKKFEVNTPLGKVTVLGTQFNVKQRGGRFEVTCYEGRVKVNYSNTEQIITKGMGVAFENGKPLETPQILAQSPEWLTNEMVFNKADLTSILGEFERHFNVTLEADKVIGNGQLFTGTIPGENIDVALQVLSTSYHLKPVKVNKNKIILTMINDQK
ncbi:FecR family protein [Flavobacterium wongokense]|uniref:FecR family protein n=1 Tax=Flavobacterium wongokense TaxID=2910674 RepID=UPI001F3B0D1A|nr:FecR domain-containing protein [Flavobacterium sp. WG47]MCF6132958.1 FecR domain-containing protein [Flavobacterium sp. WG47]